MQPASVPRQANLVDLQGEVLKAYGVVAADGTLELQREDQIQIAPRAGRKGRAALGRRYLESAVELGNIALVQEAIEPPRWWCFGASAVPWGSRPRHVPKLRSERPRAWGE